MTTFLLDSTIDWLIKSSVFLLVLLGVYKYWLENQPMHRLKRAYLLGTLLFSLAGPLVSIQMPTGWLPSLVAAQLIEKQESIASQASYKSDINRLLTVVDRIAPAVNVPESNMPMPYWLFLYGAVTALMLARFARNLFVLFRQVRINPTEPYYGATLVKLPGKALPYTFLHYLFVSAEAYDRGEIEAELFDHELAHIRQQHSLDVLLVEIVLCFCWFNPLVYWLKRAMQRNHEFLADEAVNETYLDVPTYQHLLLSKLTDTHPKLSLTSTLTFDITKQRLLMMTKQTSPARTWLTGFMATMLFLVLTVALTGTAPAQQTPNTSVPTVDGTQTQLTEKRLFEKQLTVSEMDKRFGLKPVSMGWGEKSTKGKRVLFKDLTPEQKSQVVYIAPSARMTPTEAQWSAFKNSKQYGVWVDSKRRRDNPFSMYKRTDIVWYWSSFVHKNARQPEGYLYQLELYTEEGYQKMLQEQREHPLLVLMTKEMLVEKRQTIMTK